ncbi:phytoene dehydrogenase, putative [Candidatus Koribacter versatilis Ellin345]|uniref:Phytoene dehydrogenase, putative n=1 Tax=Koribacter versatilis (strain Ellin345) TaxID=204669 RepID=Q1IR36_KORVE|nr:phytoene dehydrogenase, putative [Candidatus Koribacter versatilis Ellin345]
MVVVGAGPNGLSAAIVAAQAGYSVEVYEAEEIAGGAARTMELTLPGFHHDFGSAVHPMAAGSPFFTTLPLHDYGLEWIQPGAPLAHPLDDGTAVVLERDIGEAALALGRDGGAWRNLFGTYARRWSELAGEILRPALRVPGHPVMMAEFGMRALASASALARNKFREERTRALFAGMAAHSFLSLDEPMSAGIAMVLGITAHAVGWPIPRGGAGAITQALIGYLESLGGRVVTSHRVEELRALGEYRFAMCDVTPRQLLGMTQFPAAYTRSLQRYRYGPGVFKVDYALSSPVPWKVKECARAGTVHIGGTLEEIEASEKATRGGQHAERPFVLLSQPTLFDASRAPDGKHIAWAYCHVPNGSTFDMLPRLEAQIERFAPGFRDCVLARRVWAPADLEKQDANLVGGDIVGGIPDWKQTFFRPSWRGYSTPLQDVYLCSSSTPPGGGVHGMCGFHAATIAVKKFSR